jgi:hypothetical protein
MLDFDRSYDELSGSGRINRETPISQGSFRFETGDVEGARTLDLRRDRAAL